MNSKLQPSSSAPDVAAKPSKDSGQKMEMLATQSGVVSKISKGTIVGESPVPKGAAASSSIPQRDSRGGVAPGLARKYKLDLMEVKIIVRHFEETIPDGSKMQESDLDVILRKVFEMPASDRMKQSAWKHMRHGNEDEFEAEADCDQFMQWYTANMFSEMFKDVAPQDEMMKDALSKRYGLDITQIDKIKKKFDGFDVDGSGEIDHDEFIGMLVFILRAKSAEDIAEDRRERFWKELDLDGSGAVDFPEFINWYMKYFSPNDDEMDLSKGGGDKGGPIDEFYKSFNPTAQRHKDNKDSHPKEPGSPK
jgi:hypothetical protein